MTYLKIDPGDRLELKKTHPCGCNTFSVTRIGSDIKISCTQCGRDVTMPREKLEKAVKRITKKETDQ